MKTVLVTGSSRGIGRAIALRLCDEDYNIVVHCRHDIAAAAGVISEIEKKGKQGRLLQFDITDRNQTAKQLIDDIEKHGAYYGVVCNAGIVRDNPFPSLSEEDWDQVIHTNLDGFYNVLHPVIMPMIQARCPGRIVTISSLSGVVGNRGQVNYSAAKAGIIGATKALAIELAKRRITVNCVAPGIIETDMSSGMEMEEALKWVPLRRAGKPEEVASLVAYLLSDAAGYITRQVISVNGGMF